MSSNNRNRRWAGGVGLAVGAALAAAIASTPGVASADSSTDPFSWIGGMDLSDLSVPAQTTTSDIQVSIFGLDLFPTAGNTATAISGIGDLAIAIGNGASAQTLVSTGGTLLSTFNFAFADGASSDANSGAGSFDSAFAVGTNSFAVAGLGFLDSAIADGTNSTAHAGGMLPVCVGLECTGGGLGSFDLAAAFSDMLHATATGGNFLTDIAP